MSDKLFQNAGSRVGQTLGTVGGLYVSGQAGGGILGGVAAGEIGGEVGKYTGSKVGQILDKKCASERKELIKFREEALKQGCSKDLANKYASDMVYPTDW
jgi:hypothetical protein